MIINGGKLLGQGTYGCVFYPSLKCSSTSKDVNDKKLESGVSKVFKKESHMVEELVETQKIKTMDRKGKFTNKVLGSCGVSSSSIDKNEIERCRISKKGLSNRNLYQIVYEHKGVDLNHFIKTTPYAIEETFHYIHNLLKGIKILIDNKYIHLDLKPDNILITDTNKALLIDFGLGRLFKNLYDMKESDFLLSYDYTWYAPEFKVYYNLMDEDGMSTDSSFLKTLIKQTSKNYDDEELFDRYSVKTELKSFVSKLGKDRQDIEKSDSALKLYFDRNFAHKADVFAIGMVMHKILKHSDADLNDFELEENFKDIIFRAAHPNPFERYTIDELIENFEEKMMPYKTSTPTITVESVDSVSVNSDSNHKQKEDCMKNTLPVLRKIVDAHKMPKKFKTLRKSELCGKVKHIINGNNGNVGISQIKSSVEECMKKKKPELVKIVEEKKLPKKLKMMKKEDICKVINENESKKGSNSSYRTAVQPANNGNSVSFDDCMNYYSLKELKDLVDKNNLPRKLKQLNKGELCRSVYEILRQKTVKAIVRRGPKAKK
jgi:serine/threonine protein kinase